MIVGSVHFFLTVSLAWCKGERGREGSVNRGASRTRLTCLTRIPTRSDPTKHSPFCIPEETIHNCISLLCLSGCELVDIKSIPKLHLLTKIYRLPHSFLFFGHKVTPCHSRGIGLHGQPILRAFRHSAGVHFIFLCCVVQLAAAGVPAGGRRWEEWPLHQWSPSTTGCHHTTTRGTNTILQ